MPKPKRKIINDHSDSGFIQSSNRFILMDVIDKSKSWTELIEKVHKSILVKNNKILTNKYESLLYKEFHLYNLFKKVESTIASEFISYLIYKNIIKLKLDAIKERLMENINRKFKNKILDKDKAMDEIYKKVIEAEKTKNINRLLNSDSLFNLAGMGFGDLIDIIRNWTKSFNKKNELLDLFTDFNITRNNIIHKSMSSRILLEEEIDKGLEIGKEILKIIDDLIDQDKCAEYLI